MIEKGCEVLPFVESDEGLVLRCAGGDEEGMRLLMGRYEQRSLRFFTRSMGNRQDAEDAVLDLFLRVWRHSPRFTRAIPVSAWIHHIAVNLARDHARAAKVRSKARSVDFRDALSLSVPS